MDILEARSLLGLGEQFTKAELDTAFVKLSAEAKVAKQTQKIALLSRARTILLRDGSVLPDSAEPDHVREPKLALKYLSTTNNNVFITGPGGNGKSHLLETLYNTIKDRAVAVVAPTGTAAMRLDVPASTANSFFKLGTHAGLSFQDHSKMSSVEKAKFKVLNLLIIDEVSMVNADFLDAINLKLQAARGDDKPFGGVQVFLFGDPFQLPPVPSTDDPLMEAKLAEKYPAGNWFFEAEVYDDGNFDVIELQVNHRVANADASGAELIEYLRKIRLGDTSAETLGYFNRRLGKEPDADTYVTLVPRNRDANPINDGAMAKLPGDEHSFPGVFEKTNPKSTMQAAWDKVIPDEVLIVKVGAQVMFIKNDDQGGKLIDGKKVPRWANGHEGVVTDVNVAAKTISVLHKPSGETYEVKTSAWDIPQHEASTKKLSHGANVETLVPVVQARYVQFPIRLAWALTIHKSQGQTYENMAFEPNGVTNAGQAYVALSRAKRLSGISLKSPLNATHIQVSPEAALFMKNCNPIHF